MPLGVDQAVAELIRDGDPARSISGLDTLRGFRLYDDATASARRIHVAEEPRGEPDEVITVLLEGGFAPLGGGQPNAVGRRPAFTVRCRSDRYEASQEIAHEVYAILDYFEGSANGIPFFRVFADFEPVGLGRDREDRAGRWITTQTFNAFTKRYVLA